MGYLEHLVIENFKSYMGKITIGPFGRFTSIIGPNGSGKSNLMDAISFVLGERSSNLRVSRISQLIHGAPVGQAVSNTATVTAVMKVEDENDELVEVRFTRIIQGNSSVFKINDQQYSAKEYSSKLEELNVFINSKNFLVYQGKVEEIALKNPKDRMHMFEEISESVQFKEDYVKASKEQQDADEETKDAHLKKKGIALERKEAKAEKEQAEIYERMLDEHRDAKLQHSLFQLYINDMSFTEEKSEIRRIKKQIDKGQKKKKEIDEEIKKEKAESGKIQREVNSVEKKCEEKSNKLNNLRPTLIKARENTSHTQHKLESVKKRLEAAEKIHSQKQNIIQELQTQLNDLEKRKKIFEAQIQEEQTEKNIELEQSQLSEYHKLKETVATTSAEMLNEINRFVREKNQDQETLTSLNRKRADIERALKGKQTERDEHSNRTERLKDYIEDCKNNLRKLEDQRKELEKEVTEADQTADKINADLENVMTKLGSASVEKTESRRQQKRKELIEKLKSLYPGVLGRLIHLCEPVHKRYNVAVTKVLGRNMEAIVVDTEKVARDCMRYMKEQRCEPETFLPLDYIEANPLNDRLREITEPRGVKLVFDVIRMHNPTIRRALIFACSNSLVCDSSNDARIVSSGEIYRHQDIFRREDGSWRRQQAVSLDGTMFQKSGVISGGAYDLQRKAQRWEEKEVDNLRQDRDNLHERLKEAMKKKRKEPQLQQVVAQINGLQNRIRYSQTDYDNTKARSIADILRDIDQLEASRSLFDPQIEEIQVRMDAREEHLKQMKGKHEVVEDEVFLDFCQQIGVPNIRAYEEKELHKQQENSKRRLEFENQHSRLTNLLEYEQSNDTMINVQKWTDVIEKEEKELERLHSAEAKARADIETCQNELDDLHEKRADAKDKLRTQSKATDAFKTKMTVINKDLASLNSEINQRELKIDQLQAARHQFLIDARLNDIQLPLSSGNLSMISDDGVEQSNDSMKKLESESDIVFEFSQLNANLQGLHEDEEQVKLDELAAQVRELGNKIEKTVPPKLRVANRLEDVREKYQSTKSEFEDVRKKAKSALITFQQLKRQRRDMFMQCFDFVAAKIDETYKEISRNPGAQAYLSVDNSHEPYLDGISYNCVAPGKRFRPMDNLSGGEKTIAALALIFAVYAFRPSPFFVLDEVDAALDNTNIGKVADYIISRRQNLQCIVISLKEEFFSKADCLIGIYAEQGRTGIRSKALTADLSKYKQNEMDQN